MDTVDHSTRSRIMASVRRKSTAPEIVVRRAVAALGVRASSRPPTLPGSPDLVFVDLRKAIFVHGCFGTDMTVHAPPPPRVTRGSGGRSSRRTFVETGEWCAVSDVWDGQWRRSGSAIPCKASPRG